MKRVALALLVACLASPAWAAKSAVIDGKRVVLGKRTSGVPLFEVTDLKFYEAVESKGSKPCTVVSGKLTSRLSTKYFLVTVDILLYESIAGAAPQDCPRGTMRAVIDRPEPDKPIRFVAQGPQWKRPGVTPPTLLTHNITVSIRPWQPSDAE